MEVIVFFIITYMKKLLISLLIAGSIFASSSTAFASTNCQPIYGGGQTCISQGNLVINKMVQNPQSGAFQDNLGFNDPRFNGNQNVTFQIQVTNNGDATLSTVNVTDTLPQYVTFVSGPGSFDANTKILKFTLNNLGAGETRTFTLVAKTVDSSKLPSDQSVVCTVNQVSATSDTNMASDNSQFCIEKPATTTKGGLPIYPAPVMVKTPPTGPEMLPLIGLIPGGIGGLLLRKKSKKIEGGEK